VSAVGALQSFQELLLSSHLTSNPHQEHVFLLFGVNGKAGPEFALERTGWNDCSFRVPDERGWMPEKQPIVPRNGTIEQCYTSQLPLEKIQSKLTKSNFPVKISDDPGRFLCNFVCYQYHFYTMI
jgi:pyrrolidone-carboxylate peptidase